MILDHYGTEPLLWPPRDYTQTNRKEGWGHPPHPEGLWVSVKGEDDWPSWCQSEQFRLEALAVCTRVVLASEANVRLVEGEQQLLAFDAEYGIDYDYGGAVPFTHRRIDWIKLAKDYDGLIIAPYVRSCRLPMERGTPKARVSDWYYPWDCASGVIWRARAIAAFENDVVMRQPRRKKANG